MLQVSLPRAGHAVLELHEAGHEGVQLPPRALQLVLDLIHLLTQLGSLTNTRRSKLIQLRTGRRTTSHQQEGEESHGTDVIRECHERAPRLLLHIPCTTRASVAKEESGR